MKVRFSRADDQFCCLSLGRKQNQGKQIQHMFCLLTTLVKQIPLESHSNWFYGLWSTKFKNKYVSCLFFAVVALNHGLCARGPFVV